MHFWLRLKRRPFGTRSSAALRPKNYFSLWRAENFRNPDAYFSSMDSWSKTNVWDICFAHPKGRIIWNTRIGRFVAGKLAAARGQRSWPRKPADSKFQPCHLWHRFSACGRPKKIENRMFNFQTWIRGPKRTFGTLFLLILRNGPFRIISVAGQSRRRLVSGRHTTCTIPWLLKRANRHWCVSGKAHDVHHTLLFTSNVGIGLCPEDTIHAPYLVFNNQNQHWLVSERHTMCTRPCFLTIKVGIGLRTEDIRCAPCLVF